jgi:hypothetical protein
MKLHFLLPAALALTTLISTTASATTIVVPASATTQEGTDFGRFTANTALTGQQLLLPADMPGLSVGDKITGIHLRLQGGETGPSSLNWSSFAISMGIGVAKSSFGLLPTPAAPTLAANFVGSPTVVRAVNQQTTVTFPTTGAPRDWSSSIAFNTPYTYTGGNLLMETRTSATPNATDVLIDTMDGSGGASPANNQTTGVSTFNGGSATATTANSGILTRNWAIEFDIIPVPEPATWILTVLSSTVLSVVTARKRPRQRPA